MKVRWLVRFNDHDAGFVGEVPDDKGKYWINHRMVEPYEEPVKGVERPPRDKMVRKTRNK